MPESEFRALTPEEVKHLWVRSNRGSLARIAKHHDVSSFFVSHVLYRTKPTKTLLGIAVAKSLRRAGAPIDHTVKGAA